MRFDVIPDVTQHAPPSQSASFVALGFLLVALLALLYWGPRLLLAKARVERRLDQLARSFGIPRQPGESDAHLRERLRLYFSQRWSVGEHLDHCPVCRRAHGLDDGLQFGRLVHARVSPDSDEVKRGDLVALHPDGTVKRTIGFQHRMTEEEARDWDDAIDALARRKAGRK